MVGESVIQLGGDDTAFRLAAAYEHLGDVLETVDFETDRELADAVVDAVAATDRAYRLETERSDARRGRRRRQLLQR